MSWLWDMILASLVLAAVVFWGGQVAGDWVASRVATGEVRTVAELTRSGRLLVEGDVGHAGRSLVPGAAPIQVALADLEAADLRSPALGTQTPARRALSLWLWRDAASPDALLVIARARGELPLSRLPAARDGVTGVGAMLGTNTRLRGPGLNFDMAGLNALVAGFATTNDVFALDHVALAVTCRSYLYRVEVDCDGDGTADVIANTMETDLDMGDMDITGASNVTAASAAIGTLEGATRFSGAVTVDGEVEVAGMTTLGDLTVNGALAGDSAEIAGTLTVPDITATGTVTGADLTLSGTAVVSGEARLGDADVGTLTVGTLNVELLSSDRGLFQDIFADTATFTSCTGCGP